MLKLTGAIALFTFGLVGVGLLQCFVYWRQAALMKAGLELTKRQLTTSEAMQSAHLVIDNFTPAVAIAGTTIRIHGSFTIKNVGGSVAKAISIQHVFGISRRPPDPLRMDPTPNTNGPHLAAGEPAEFNLDYSTGMRDEVLKREMVLSVLFAVSYVTIFNSPQVVHAYYVYNPIQKRFYVAHRG